VGWERGVGFLETKETNPPRGFSLFPPFSPPPPPPRPNISSTVLTFGLVLTAETHWTGAKF